MRVGIGYDVHALAEGRDLVLGGVHIPYVKGLQGHSDADVLLHAVMDALLGAAALGDIGQYFPDSDPRYKNMDSAVLLARTRDILREHGYRCHNLDCTLVAQEPRIAPYSEQMRGIIAQTLEMDPAGVSVKATTTEGLGFTGRKEGIAALAVCCICEAEQPF
jgi:2-C-methyl-D-erythritol 2,4-cyclodiphosphate synthase